MTTPNPTNFAGHDPPPEDHVLSPPANIDDPALFEPEELERYINGFPDPHIQQNQDHDVGYPSPSQEQQWALYNPEAQPSTSRKRAADDVEVEAIPGPSKKRKSSATKEGSNSRPSNKQHYQDSQVIQNQQSNGSNRNDGNDQEVPGDKGDEEEPQKQKRTLQACQNCKAKKMRCDKETGRCRPCAKQGKECIQTDPVKGTEYLRLEWESHQEAIRCLRARVMELESCLNFLGGEQTIREMMEKQEEKKEPSVKLEPNDDELGGGYLLNDPNLGSIGAYNYPNQGHYNPNTFLQQPNPNLNQPVEPDSQIPVGGPEQDFAAFAGPFFANGQDQANTMLQQTPSSYPSAPPTAPMGQYMLPGPNRQPQPHPQAVDYYRLGYNGGSQDPGIAQQSRRYQPPNPPHPQPQVHHQPTQNRPNNNAGGNTRRQPPPPFDSMENTKHQHPG
ncbi:hypothetical protein FQN50_002651 [Emmonsiellopsis sp. PD_5]|nr:hypothetical protein FQN50_002651 [Emmonsiellopsis sp. PD_5]